MCVDVSQGAGPLSDEIVHIHRSEKPRDCSKGHTWRLRFRANKNELGWLKICRRCAKVESTSGAFDQDGIWRKRNRVAYQPDEV